jgi:hypothetical protein
VVVDPEQHYLVEPAALALDDLLDDLGEERDYSYGEQEAQGQLDRERQPEPAREAKADLFAEKLSREHGGILLPDQPNGPRIILLAT